MKETIFADSEKSGKPIRYITTHDAITIGDLKEFIKSSSSHELKDFLSWLERKGVNV